MVLWFVGAGVVAVWVVFRSPALDYRLVALGAVLPVGEAALGGPRVLHTLAAPVVALVVVMAATRRRRLLRRRWLGLPIGLFVHLVLDGTWARAHLFWWPLFGASFAHGQVPELTRGGWGWALEVIGLLCIFGMVKRFRLYEPARRKAFLRTGQFSRDLARGPEAGC
ncbi:MAG: hypothetical protein ABI276_00785 [Acidimicrobiales bacterium]